MIKSLVIDGSAVGILSSINVTCEIACEELSFIPFTDGILRPLNLALCAMPPRQLSSAANLVLARIVTGFGGRLDNVGLE